MNTLFINKITKYFFRIVITFSICLSIIILSIKFTLNYTPLYYHDIGRLNIESTSNLNKQEIIENYNYLISFVSSKDTINNFNIPSFPSSSKGMSHFYEVKNVFTILNYILYISLIISIIGIIYEIKNKNFQIFKWSSIGLLIIQIIVVTPLIINFDKSFTFFHKLLFNNNNWLFDKKADPVITILPKPFFLHCALLIITLVTISCVVFAILYKIFTLKTKNKKQTKH